MKTAVILAFNTRNAGMYSVDLAAFRLFESFGATVDYFMASGRGAQNLIKYGQLAVHQLASPDILRNYDNIVYWGDFTTNPTYGMDEYCSQLSYQDGETSRDKAFNLWARTFLLRGQDKGARRFFSFGQNFQTLPFAARQMDLNVLAPFYERFDSIMPRDSISFAELGGVFPQLLPETLVEGTDCALLLDEPYPTERSGKSGMVGGFFYRSKISNVGALSRALAQRGHRIVNVERWLTLPMANAHDQFRMMCEQLRGFDCVVTDTYHFAVNAIREGITPIVFGRAQAPETTVSDFKKKILMRDLGAEDLYVEISDDALSDEMIGAVVDQVDRIARAETPHPVHQNARDVAGRARGDFRRRFLG